MLPRAVFVSQVPLDRPPCKVAPRRHDARSWHGNFSSTRVTCSRVRSPTFLAASCFHPCSRRAVLRHCDTRGLRSAFLASAAHYLCVHDRWSYLLTRLPHALVCQIASTPLHGAAPQIAGPCVLACVATYDRSSRATSMMQTTRACPPPAVPIASGAHHALDRGPCISSWRLAQRQLAPCRLTSS
jgi:hypothetical protein